MLYGLDIASALNAKRSAGPLVCLVIALAFAQGCSAPAEDNDSTQSDDDTSASAFADEQPQPAGQARVELDGVAFDLDVYGCQVSSLYSLDKDDPKGLADITLDAVSPGVSIIDPPRHQSYDLTLQVQDPPSTVYPVLMLGENGDDSWSFNTVAVTKPDFDKLATSSGSIHIDNERMDLTTGATPSIAPRPGTASIIAPATGQFDIEVTSFGRRAPEQPLVPLRVRVNARCELVWVSAGNL